LVALERGMGGLYFNRENLHSDHLRKPGGAVP
jgi:hypothetical protein